MISRVLVVCAVLSTGVRSLPVTSGQLESEDVKVMKCIVEALADVLSRPSSLPVSEECLLTLRSDDRLVAILRHHNFLKELQDIALEGNQKRAQEEAPVQQTQSADENPDRSMLESLGGPGERSILVPEQRRVEEKSWDQIQPDEDGVKDPRRDEGGMKRAHKDKKVERSEHNEKRDSVKKKSTEEIGEEKQKREDLKRNGSKLWSKQVKAAQVQKKAAEKQTEKREHEEMPHHSKEISNQEVEEEKRSPEEEELQLIARTTEEREDEGSGAKKLEIESLATIESELESVAQKLHALSRTDRGQQHV